MSAWARRGPRRLRLTWTLVTAAVLTVVTDARAAEPSPPRAHPTDVVEVIRLAEMDGRKPVGYELGDETRPVLAAPAETRLSVTAPPNQIDVFSFPLPPTPAGRDVIATGSYRRARRRDDLQPQRILVRTDADGKRTAMMKLPVLARGVGPRTDLDLVLTAPPTAGVVETESPAVTVPEDAELHFAYALSEAAGVPGSAPVRLEVAARVGKSERALWSVVLRPDTREARRWSEATVALRGLGSRSARLVFRARADGAGRAALFPIWADPTITAPGRRPAARRNVVLISIDTLRADHLGTYGAYRPTSPAIDAFAAESVVFSDVWATWPETTGSHMSLFTSRYVSEHGVKNFAFAPAASLELLAERLRREGYLTRAFTEDGGVWANAGFARGFSAYGERRSADFVNRGEAAATFADAGRWLESHAGRSFFLFVHTYQVHGPYTPPKAYKRLFLGIPAREVKGQVANALNYDRELRYTDDQVGPFLATLRRLGLAERTIVVLTADHGEEFGEHGGMGHGRTLHREVLRVPLIVWAPGLLAPRRVSAAVSLLDVAPTLLELLGLQRDPGYRGTSLAAAARGTPVPAERAVFGELDRHDAIYHDTLRFLSVRRGGRTAIVDLERQTTRCYGADDPGEERPSDACPDLRALIEEHRGAEVPIAPAAAPTPDAKLIDKMRALGYVE